MYEEKKRGKSIQAQNAADILRAQGLNRSRDALANVVVPVFSLASEFSFTFASLIFQTRFNNIVRSEIFQAHRMLSTPGTVLSLINKLDAFTD